MATTYMTPAERRLERARALQMKRYAPQIKQMQQEQRQATLKAYEAAQREAANERANMNAVVRTLSTVGDVVGNVITGALKGIEGIVDFGLAVDGVLNPLAYLFDYRDATKEFAERDIVGTYIDAPMEDFFKYSYTKDGSIGQIIEDVASGVGQMLPAVAAAYFTGGASIAESGASIAGMTVPQAVALGVITTSAAGNATEQAYQEGAGRYEGLLYGTASGAVEAVTEKLTGGIGMFGPGLLNGVVKSTAREGVEAVAKTGIKRVVANAIGEAGEEVIAELANPALKTIYKGKDALNEYGDAEYWKGVGHAGLVGGLTSVAHGGTTGYIMKQSGAYADVASIRDEISAIDQEAKRLDDKNQFSPKVEKEYFAARKRNYQLLETVLKNANQKIRADILGNKELSEQFNEDGSMKPEFAKSLDSVEDERYNKKYYNLSARGREQAIADALSETEAELVKKYAERNGITEDEAKSVIGDLSVYDGDLTEAGDQAYSKLKQGLSALNRASGVDVPLVIVNENSSFNAMKADGIIYIGVDALETGRWARDLVHEYTHFEEGTQEYAALIDHLRSDDGLLQTAIDMMQGKTYEFDREALDEIMRKQKAGKELTVKESRIVQDYVTELGAHMSEALLGTESFIDRLVALDGNLAQKVVAKIKALSKGLSRMRDADAKAQHEFLKKAEDLYLKAAQKVSNARLIHYITTGEWDDEEKFKLKTEKYIPYSIIGDENVSLVKRELARTLYKGVGNSIATQTAVAVGDTVYIVDSGKEDGVVRVGFRKIQVIEDVESRNEFIKEKLHDAIRNDQVSDEISQKYQNQLGEHIGRNMRQEHKEELSADNEQSDDNQSGISGANGDRRVRFRLNETEEERARRLEKESQLLERLKEMYGVKESEPSNAKFSLKSDAEYLRAVESGDMETAQRMVDEAAKAGGYGSPMLFHGTTSFGFTEFDLSKSEDKISIFATTDESVAGTYADEDAKSRISERANITPEQLESADSNTLIELAEKHLDLSLEAVSAKEHIESAREMVRDVIGDIETLFEGKESDSSAKVINALETIATTDNYSEFKKAFDAYERAVWSTKDEAVGKTVGNRMNKAYRVLATALESNGVFYTDGSEVYSRTKLVNRLSPKLFSGVYRLYARMRKPFHIYGNGSAWNKLDGHKIGKSGYVSTKDVVRYAKEKGYDSVVFHDIAADSGYSGGSSSSDVYAFFSENALKSADPVTYDDNGNVIPLSERFDIRKRDLRYSLKDGDSSKRGMPEQKQGEKEIKHSRTSTETVTLSKGQLAALRANYHGDKVFTKKKVSEALKTIDALQALPAKVRNDLADHLWRGYNERLNQQGFDLYTEIMWHKIHAEVLQENGFEMTEEEIAQMDDQIVAALQSIVDSGTPSTKAKLESDTSAEGYRKQATYWRNEHQNAMQYHKQLNRLKYELEKLENAKKGLYVSSANYRGDSFKVAINELARMNWRGGLVRAEKIREHFAALDAWYSKSNPLYADDGNGQTLFRENISQALHELGNRKNGSLSIEELYAAETVVKYFQHEIEAHNAIWKDGKRVDAAPLSNRYIKRIDEARQAALKCGVWQSLTRNKFARLVADPAMLMRQADCYMEGGFFTEQYEELRRGVIDASVKERELAQEFEKFWEEHKAYGKRYNSDTVTFDGKEMPLQEAISLYMTMKREHAFAGIAGAGFEIDGKNARENISDGFADAVEEFSHQLYDELPPEKLLALSDKARSEIERKAVAKAIKERRDALEAQFTDDDKALIAIMERGYEACRELKVAVDNIIQGFSNVTHGYYYPIVRAGLAELVDAYTGFEGDRVSSLSMNKETTKNAHKLFIEPAHIVYMRHLKATSMYHGLGVFTDNFNRLYNLDISKAQMTEQAKAEWAYEQEETNFDIISLVEKVKKNLHKDDDLIELGSISSEMAETIKGIVGKDFTGYKLVIEARQVEHILRDHGENGKTDHSMANDEDIAKVLFAIKNPDSVVEAGTTMAYSYMDNGKNRPAKTILYERSIGEKSYYVVQTAVDTKKKTLHIVSAFIGGSGFKKGAPQLTSAQGLGATSKNAIAGTPGNATADNGSQVASPTKSIPQNDDGVNANSETFYRGGPKTVRDALGRSNEYTKEMVKYFKEMKQDVEGISKKRSQEKAYNDAVAYIRSVYATYQLGANPKVWLTQFSSLIAATNMIDASSIIKGLGVSSKDVDKYCRLAWLRNDEGSAALAQAVSEKTNAVQRVGRGIIQKVRDSSMYLIGRMDRLVIKKLYSACQVQVEKQGIAKIGTEKNKIEAGKLLERVILETQQNSLATERSAAMRSSDELLRGETMFSADSMKCIARLFDAWAEGEVLRALRRDAKQRGDKETIKKLDVKIKENNKKRRRATSAFVSVAIYNALIALGFKWLFDRDDEEDVGTVVADTFGNMLGGIPIVRDVWSFFQDGFEMDHFLLSSFNDILGTAASSYALLNDAMSGREVTKQDVLSTMRKILYAAGQLSGVPVRNAYNTATGLMNRIVPDIGYKVESMFYQKAYKADLKVAIEKGDEKMVAMISDLMVDESFGTIDAKSREAIKTLIGKGYDVLPRSVGDSVTYDGEEYEFTARSRKRFEEVYGIADEAVKDLVSMSKFSSADAAVQAKAIRFIYDVYYNLALEDFLGVDIENKTVLFAQALDIEKLALIVATARSIEGDKDRNGKTINGSKKLKVVKYIESLRMTAAEKYMIMGYLGYKNVNGEAAVRSYINKLSLTKQEKTKLLSYSGYAA